MEDTISKEKGKWYNAIEEYRLELGLTWENLRAMDKLTLKKKVREYDTMIWYNEMSKKQSLRFYIKEKMEVKYDMCYRNSLSSSYYARARINSLKLEEQIGRGKENYNKNCKLCNEEEEDMVHFIVKCEKLELKRNYNLIDKEIVDPEERMRVLLFRNENRQEIGRMIKDIWETRGQLLKEREKSMKEKTNHCRVGTSTQAERKKKSKEKYSIQLKVVRDQDIKKIQDLKKIARNQDLIIKQERKKMKQIERDQVLERKEKQKEKNRIQLKVVRDQEVKKIQNIKKMVQTERKGQQKKEENNKSIQLKGVRDQDVKKIQDIKEKEQIKKVVKQTKKKENKKDKNKVILKVIRDQDIKKIEDIKKRETRR